jgi:hypothetical protein
VPLPRPRSLEIVPSPEFQEIAVRVRDSLQLPTAPKGDGLLG